MKIIKTGDTSLHNGKKCQMHINQTGLNIHMKLFITNMQLHQELLIVTLFVGMEAYQQIYEVLCELHCLAKLFLFIQATLPEVFKFLPVVLHSL